MLERFEGEPGLLTWVTTGEEGWFFECGPETSEAWRGMAHATIPKKNGSPHEKGNI